MGRFVNILRQPIYASIPRTDDPTTVTINLADLHIVTDDDLIVAYQHISSSLTGQIRFPIGLTGARSLRPIQPGRCVGGYRVVVPLSHQPHCTGGTVNGPATL